MERSVQVEIAGQSLTIRTGEGPEYVERLAAFVDGQVRELVGDRRNFNLPRVALLVAIQLADQLFRERDLHRRLRARVEARLADVEAALAAHEAQLDALDEPAADGPAPPA